MNGIDVADCARRVADLAAILLVSAFKYGDEWAGPELVSHGGNVAQTRCLAKSTDETSALRAGAPEAGPFRKNDGPGKKTEDEKNQQHGLRHGAALPDKVRDLATDG